MTDTERKNLVTTLNLEYGATHRYALQARRFLQAGVVSLIEGVRRNEGEHIDDVLGILEADADGAPEGYRTLYLHTKLNLEFEKEAVKLYGQFSRETDNPAQRDTFRKLLKSEAGHVRLFEDTLKKMEEGTLPKIFFCPLCGWEMDYGQDGKAGQVEKCEKCGARYELVIENGDFALKAAQ